MSCAFSPQRLWSMYSMVQRDSWLTWTLRSMRSGTSSKSSVKAWLGRSQKCPVRARVALSWARLRDWPAAALPRPRAAHHLRIEGVRTVRTSRPLRIPGAGSSQTPLLRPLLRPPLVPDQGWPPGRRPGRTRAWRSSSSGFSKKPAPYSWSSWPGQERHHRPGWICPRRAQGGSRRRHCPAPPGAVLWRCLWRLGQAAGEKLSWMWMWSRRLALGGWRRQTSDGRHQLGRVRARPPPRYTAALRRWDPSWEPSSLRCLFSRARSLTSSRRDSLAWGT
mmetsp:Transcript_931/g.2321  ORF Transcript_931/g.2321 Transcript_931/m.2321 type:complete len:277 (+) Transcript_931:253-1083(+)